MDGRGNGKADGEGDLFGVRSDGGAKKRCLRTGLLCKSSTEAFECSF